MGYFSNLAAEYVPYDHDHSYTPPEKQLLWRLEELEDRYHELLTQKTGNRDEGVCFSDVRKAIDLAISDLKERYGIQVREETAQVDPVVDEITGMQISFLDILSAPACRKQLQAA